MQEIKQTLAIVGESHFQPSSLAKGLMSCNKCMYMRGESGSVSNYQFFNRNLPGCNLMGSILQRLDPTNNVLSVM